MTNLRTLSVRKRNWLLIAAVLLLMLLGKLSGTPQRASHPYFGGTQMPYVVAHQGGNQLRPGNTMLAFAHAVALGVDVLEMDVHLSADGELVVMHDATVERTTNGKGALVHMTLAQIKVLDAAYHWPHDEVKKPYRGSGVTVPTLQEVLERFPEQRINVELKPDSADAAEALCALLTASGRLDRALVASFHHGALHAYRRACSTGATSASPRETVWFNIYDTIGLLRMFDAPAVALQLPESRNGVLLLDQDLVRAARAWGLNVDYWTLNEVHAMRRAITAGARGIITDRPDLLLDELGRL